MFTLAIFTLCPPLQREGRQVDMRSHRKDARTLLFVGELNELTILHDGMHITIGEEHVRIVSATHSNAGMQFEIANANTRPLRVASIREPGLSVSLRTNAR